MKLSELNFNRYLYKDLGASDEIDSSLLASNLFDKNKNKLSQISKKISPWRKQNERSRGKI